jgi:riboflavin kinase/FMN adenylyltransferase
MMLLRDSSSLPEAATGCVVALGNFDGLHLGHAAVIGKAAAIANEAKKPFVVMTFEPHPRHLFRPDLPPLRILPFAEKLRLLRMARVDYLRVMRFTRAFSKTSATDFVTRMLHETLRVSHVVTGEDFVFGHNREGNAALLEGMAASLGFAATACPQMDVDGMRCSSTRIREALAEGRVENAAKLLGRPYMIAGYVRRGDQRGRTMGYPTANILPPPVFLPAYGIYAVRATVRGRQVGGVASFGIRPDYPLKHPLLEAHFFDWDQDIYGERIQVELVRYLRPERNFGDMEALKKQIADDATQARTICGG